MVVMITTLINCVISEYRIMIFTENNSCQYDYIPRAQFSSSIYDCMLNKIIDIFMIDRLTYRELSYAHVIYKYLR